MKKYILIVLMIGFAVGIGLSYFSAITVENTGDDEFCVSCHSMEQAYYSYQEDTHGGNNKYGINVKCTDCHLPHESMFVYLTTKAYKGAHDLWWEIFLDKEKFDWIGNLEKREKYTYSSGCIRCHKLEDIKHDIPKAFMAHRDFEMGVVKSCIRCHKHVGHKHIADYYLKNKSAEEK